MCRVPERPGPAWSRPRSAEEAAGREEAAGQEGCARGVALGTGGILRAQRCLLT